MNTILHIINEMSPYLLLGFFFGGILHAFVPSVIYSKYLSKPNFRSVFWAAVLGVPLPLCSCGVIPTAMSLRKEGASKGATTSFLISTPQTGVDSIMATYGILGLPFAIIRPIAAFVTALFGGALSNRFSRDRDEKEEAVKDNQTCGSEKTTFAKKCVEALKFAFYDMIQSIGKWLLLGILVAALITILVPDSAFALFRGNTMLSMILVLVIAVPMYVCATGSIPLAVTLILKGLTPGAGLVLLMAGPACNVASMLVVKKVLGTRSLIIYLVSIIIGAVGFGCLVDFLHFNGIVNFTGNLVASTHACCGAGSDGIFSIVCTILLLLLVANSMILPRILNKKQKTQIMNNNTRIYPIQGVECNHCKAAAEKALLSVEGVTAANVNVQDATATVEGTADPELLAKAIDEVGFTLIIQ